MPNFFAGDVSKLSIVPRYSDISKEFSCHLQHHAPEYLYVITYTPRIASMNLSLPARSKRFPYYNITHQEVGSDSVEYLLVSHHTNIPLHEEVMFLGTFGKDDEGKKNVDFSLHSLKESREFNRAKSFNIRRKSSTSLRTKIQFERPFLYSTGSWKLDGCEKNVSQIITPQPLYHTQGQPLKQMIRKKRNDKFVYELLVVGKTPHVKFTIPGMYHLHQRRFRRIYLSTNPSPHDPQYLLLEQTNRPMKTPGRIFSIFPSCQSDYMYQFIGILCAPPAKSP